MPGEGLELWWQWASLPKHPVLRSSSQGTLGLVLQPPELSSPLLPSDEQGHGWGVLAASEQCTLSSVGWAGTVIVGRKGFFSLLFQSLSSRATHLTLSWRSSRAQQVNLWLWQTKPVFSWLSTTLTPGICSFSAPCPHSSVARWGCVVVPSPASPFMTPAVGGTISGKCCGHQVQPVGSSC